MPELSRFYGIIVRMYCEPVPHHASHFHAHYGDDVVVYGLNPIEVLAGSFPSDRLDWRRLGPSCTSRS